MSSKKSSNTLPIHVKSEKSFENFLDRLAYPSVIHSKEKYVYANQAAAELFKVKSPKNIVGSPTLRFVTPDNIKLAKKRINAVFKDGAMPERESLIMDDKGNIQSVTVAATLITYKNQSAVLATFQNRDAQRQVKEKLQASEKQYRQLVENINEGIIKFDPEEVITYVNKRFCKMVGYSSKELIGKIGHDLLIVTDDSKETVRQAIKDRMLGESTRYEVQLRTKSQKLIWVSMNGTPIFNEIGEYEGSMGIVRDISDSKKSQLALEQSEQRFRGLFENAHDLIQSISPKGFFLFVNGAWLKTLGYKKSEVRKLNMFDIIHPESIKHCTLIFAKVLQGRTANNIEATFVKKNGEKVEVHGNVTLHKTETGEIMTQGIFTDVTKDRQAESALKKSEERYRTLVEKMNEGIIMVDNDEVIEYVNQRFCKIVGFKYKDLVGRRGPDVLVHDKESRDRIKKMLKFRRRGISTKYEVRFKRKNGEWIDVSMNGTPLYDIHGKVRGSMGIVTDITESRLAEGALLESEEKYRTLVEKMGEGVIRLNTDNIIEYVNDRFCEILGYSKKDLLGKNRFEVLTVDDDSLSEVKKSIGARKKGESSKYELKHKRKNGEWIWISINGSPLLDEKGYTVGSMGIVTDITSQRHAETEIKELNLGLEKRVEQRTAELEKANTEIKALLQEMHHRVKNNLQIVSSLLNMQAASVGDDFIATAFRESQDRIQTMAFIHESLYLNESMSKISVVKYLEPLVKDRIRANANLINNIELETDFPDIDFKIDTMLPIGLLLNELVTNSLKHAFPDNRKGKIKVELTEDTKNKLVLNYSDNGIGFPTEDTGDSTGSLGLILIDSFAMQLEGDLKRTGAPGTSYQIKFKLA